MSRLLRLDAGVGLRYVSRTDERMTVLILRAILVLVMAALSIVSAGCRRNRVDRRGPVRKSSDRPSSLITPLDRGLSSDAKLSFVNLVRYRLNLGLPPDEVERWDLWAEGSSPFPLPDGKRAFLLSFRRAPAPDREEGILVMGLLEGQTPVIVAQWKIVASIGDMHPVDLGPDVGVFIHVMSSGPVGRDYRMLFHHLLRLRNHRFEVTWSARWGYSRSNPSSYMPPIIRFFDTNGDGTKEVLVRVPGAGISKSRRHRWAVFRWDGYEGRFLPDRGLAWSPVAEQEPTWAATGFLEAIAASDSDAASRLTAYPIRGCSRPEELIDFLTREGVTAAGVPKLSPKSGKGRSVVTVPMRRRSGPDRYLLELQVVGDQTPLPRWRICSVRLLRW